MEVISLERNDLVFPSQGCICWPSCVLPKQCCSDFAVGTNHLGISFQKQSLIHGSRVGPRLSISDLLTGDAAAKAGPWLPFWVAKPQSSPWVPSHR